MRPDTYTAYVWSEVPILDPLFDSLDNQICSEQLKMQRTTILSPPKVPRCSELDSICTLSMLKLSVIAISQDGVAERFTALFNPEGHT